MKQERARERALLTAIVFNQNPLSLRERQNLKISQLAKIGGDEEKKKRVVVLCCRPRQNVKLGTLSCSPATTTKKCTKKRDARAKLLFC